MTDPERALEFVTTDEIIAELKARSSGFVVVYSTPPENGECREFDRVTIECGDQVQALGLLDYGKAMLMRHMFSQKE